MNDHIKRGNEALRQGDTETAKVEFYLALDDPNPITQRIANNRLLELFPETVYVSTHSRLYHRLNCPAKNIMHRGRYKEFKDWDEAERAGFEACPQCRPSRILPSE
jgi:hypothetical protein